MSSYSTILVARDEEQDSVAILTLNRPEALNSFNKEMVRDLKRAYKDLDSDPTVRIIVVTGAGRAFCAGADISEGFGCLLYTSPSPRDATLSRMPSSA